MSTLSSSSTIEQVEASYDDNASYAEDRDPGKCRAFITACRMLLRRYPKMIAKGAEHTELNPDLIQKEMQTAQTWLQANDIASPRAGGPGVTRASFENFKLY